MAFPDWLEPMAATLTQERFTGPEWVFERKLDGIRLLAFKHGAEVRLLSRNRLPQNASYPGGRRGDRGPAGARRDPRRRGDGRLGPAGRGDYHVFDVLWLERPRPDGAAARRRARASCGDCRCSRRSQLVERRSRTRSRGSAPARRAGRASSPSGATRRYEHRRSPHWLKMKCEATQELVVGGFTDPQGARVGLGALLVGYFDGDDFVFAGQGRHRLRHEAAARPARAARRARSAGAAVHEGGRPAAAARALGAARRSWCRSRSSSGPSTASCATRGCSASASTRRRAKSSREQAVITIPEKVLFPDDGITKGELAAYYEAVAPVMLPHIAARPVTMERFPAGIGAKGFIQKDVSKGFPDVAGARRGAEEGRHRPLPAGQRHADRCSGWRTRTASRRTSGRRALPELDSPTSASSISIRREDDPDVLRAAALAVRDLLDELGLPSWVKTSGSKGFHIVVPLDGKAHFDEVAAFAARASGPCSSSATRST